MTNKQLEINEVWKLYLEEHAIDAITRLTGYAYQTVNRYLVEECSSKSCHYECGMPGKLAPCNKKR